MRARIAIATSLALTFLGTTGALPAGSGVGVGANASYIRRDLVRRLWGRDRGGRFRTFGRHSQATVRGTRWLTADTCAGTLTFVKRGAVVVRDITSRRNVLVRAGHRYLARAPRRAARLRD